MNRKPALIIFPLIIFFVFILKLFPYSHYFAAKFNFEAIDYLYRYSQYNPDPNQRRLFMLDWDLYPYSGIVYLTQGKLDLVNVEHPPLGKYLLGLSALVFHNPSVIQIPLALICLLLVYFYGLKIFNNPWLSALAPLALLFEPLFFQQIIYSLLDLLQLTLILLFIYSAVFLSKKKPRTFILGLTLGALAGVKFPVLAIIIGICLAIYYLMIEKKHPAKILILLKVFSLAIGFYLLVYLPLFIEKKNLLNGLSGFINLHYRAVKIHLSHVPEYKPLAPLKVIFLNQWPCWWDKATPYVKAEEWRFTWPLLGIILLFSPALYYFLCRQIKNRRLILLFLFCWLYFIFINSRLFFPSYFLPIMPFAYLFLVLAFKNLSSLIIKKAKASKLTKFAPFSKFVSPK